MAWKPGVTGQTFTNSRVSLQNPANTFKSTLNGLGLLTGQIGYAANDVLFYAKRRCCGRQSELRPVQHGDRYGPRLCRTRPAGGGVVGVGLEYGVTPNWTVGVEYDYLWRVSDSNVPGQRALPAPAVTSISTNTKTDVSMVTLRVNYRFGGPVVAKY